MTNNYKTNLDLIKAFIKEDVFEFDESFKVSENFTINIPNGKVIIDNHLTPETEENIALKSRLEITIKYILKKGRTPQQIEEELNKLQNLRKPRK
jgi:hypothetical protein